MLDPTSLVGIATIAGIGTMIGGPVGFGAAAIAGAVLHTSKVFLDVQTKRFEYDSERNKNEVAYIIEARDKLTSPKRWYQFWK